MGNHQIENLLDFGCGDGYFTESLIKALQFDSRNLNLHLVEIGKISRDKATERLSRGIPNGVYSSDHLSPDTKETFDIIIANHSLYYVPNLKETTKHLYKKLRANGLFLVALAGRSNFLINIWKECFSLLDMEIPYYLSEQFENILLELAIPYKIYNVQYKINFPDSKENRLKILRFLLSHYLERLPIEEIIQLFDSHQQGPEIMIETEHPLFLISRSDAR